MRFITDSNPDAIVLSLDGVGAFEHVRRAAFMCKHHGNPQLRAPFPSSTGCMARSRASCGRTTNGFRTWSMPALFAFAHHDAETSYLQSGCSTFSTSCTSSRHARGRRTPSRKPSDKSQAKLSVTPACGRTWESCGRGAVAVGTHHRNWHPSARPSGWRTAPRTRTASSFSGRHWGAAMAQDVASLPTRLGGLGLRSAMLSAPSSHGPRVACLQEAATARTELADLAAGEPPTWPDAAAGARPPEDDEERDATECVRAEVEPGVSLASRHEKAGNLPRTRVRRAAHHGREHMQSNRRSVTRSQGQAIPRGHHCGGRELVRRPHRFHQLGHGRFDAPVRWMSNIVVDITERNIFNTTLLSDEITMSKANRAPTSKRRRKSHNPR